MRNSYRSNTWRRNTKHPRDVPAHTSPTTTCRKLNKRPEHSTQPRALNQRSFNPARAADLGRFSSTKHIQFYGGLQQIRTYLGTRRVREFWLHESNGVHQGTWSKHVTRYFLEIQNTIGEQMLVVGKKPGLLFKVYLTRFCLIQASVV